MLNITSIDKTTIITSIKYIGNKNQSTNNYINEINPHDFPSIRLLVSNRLG
jgi:hypothetical protein